MSPARKRAPNGKVSTKGAGGEFGRALRKRLTEIIDDDFGGIRLAFATACGIGAPLVTDWLKGRHLPSTDHLRQIAEEGELSLNWLLWGIGPRGLHQTREPQELERELVAEIRKRLRKRGVPLAFGQFAIAPDAVVEAATDLVQKRVGAWNAYRFQTKNLRREIGKVGPAAARELTDLARQLAPDARLIDSWRVDATFAPMESINLGPGWIDFT